MAAAAICNVDRVFTIGGAQAVAALAYGTATIPPVDKIVGPGNAYVAAAKRRVFGVVGIDMVAGPSEILVVGDGSTDPDWVLTVEFLERWEANHGRIREGAWLVLRSDWSKRVSDPAAFLNLREDGAHTPGPAQATVEWLIRERNVHGFAVETINTDAGQSVHWPLPYPCHTLMHGANRYGLQCLRNLDQLPPTGALILSAPLKIQGGSGSPLRVLALVPG